MKKSLKSFGLSLCSLLVTVSLASSTLVTINAASELEETTTEETVMEEDADEGMVDEAEVTAGTFTATIDMSHYDAEESVRLWVPAAASDDYQEISNVSVEVAGDNAEIQENTDELGNDMYYVEWDAEDTDRVFTYTFDVVRQEVLSPELVEEGEINLAEFEEYLQATSLIPLDGEIKETSDEIVGEETTVLGKAQLIYDWIYENMERDNDVIGCGTGDVKQLLLEPKGKCTDISSMFIALLRAQEIPAREVFGVRLSNDDEAEITTYQHCWTEFYLPGTGWVTADPADVLKLVLTEELSKDDPVALEAKDYFFGNVDSVRVAFSTGRDIELNPQQEGEALNTFGYPYAEVDGEVIDCYLPEDFVYSIAFTGAE